ncbi:hypothetical protein EON65_56585 [archaeon]|nr:MAG: hypothetical protein EON65_56585 [archaeon]
MTRKSRSKKDGKKSRDVAEVKKAANKSSNKAKNSALLNGLNDSASFEAMQRDLESLKSSLRISAYFQALLASVGSSGLQDTLNQVDVVVALGLGSFSTSKNAILQLAMLQLLRESLLDTSRPVSVLAYDPVMREVDRALCEALDITILNSNTKGRYRLTISELFLPNRHVLQGTSKSTVLYFMPHCPFRLYSNVLWDHWHELDSILIFGNRYASYTFTLFYAYNIALYVLKNLVSRCIQRAEYMSWLMRLTACLGCFRILKKFLCGH